MVWRDYRNGGGLLSGVVLGSNAEIIQFKHNSAVLSVRYDETLLQF